MNHPEQYPKKPTATAGFFAMLDGLLHVKGSGAPWLRGLILAPFLTALYLICFAPGTALARTVHVYTSSFGSEGSGNGQFQGPVGVAVDEVALGQAGDVYVADTGNNRVEWFTPEGEFKGEFNGASTPAKSFSSPEAIAVDNSTNPLDPSAGDVYVADTGHNVIDRFSATGTYEGQLTETTGGTLLSALHGVAIDSEGNVWVYENEAAGEGEVAEFSDTGTFLKAFNTERGTKPGIALDSGGHVFAVFASGDVGEYEAATGTELGKNESENATGIAVDTGDLLIDTGGRVEEYELAEPFSSRVEAFPSEGLSESEAIAASATGTVYATERGANHVEVFSEGTLPEVNTQAVSGLAVHSVTLNGTVNPEGAEVTSCEFEYGTSETYGSKAACNPAPGSGNAPVAVGANLTGLQPDIIYHYRLAASNAEHLSEATPDETFTTRGAGITEEQVTHVEATAATLQASIDPNESETTYHFEYDTTPYTSPAAHGTSLPVPSASIGSGTSPVPVSLQLKGLQLGTSYYYRVVAVSELEPGIFETFDGPDKTLTTNVPPSSGPDTCPNAKARAEQPYGPGLPDCRAYELVSPLNKNDNNAAHAGSRASISDESPALAWVSEGSFSEPKSALLNSRYLSHRGPDGWVTKDISPPYDALVGELTPPFFELLFTPDLSEGVVDSEFTPLVKGEPEGYVNLYVANTSTNTYQPVTTVHPPTVKPYTGDNGVIPFIPDGASTDLSHVVFQEKGNLTNDGEVSAGDHVYEWVNGALYLVDVPPAGTKFEAQDEGGAPSALLGGVVGAAAGDDWHAVSGDGSRVFFTAGEGKGEEVGGQLYLRKNPDQPQSPYDAEGKCTIPTDACTINVSASQRTNEKGERDPDPNDHRIMREGQVGLRSARYWDASADGSRVFFTSRAELTNEANTGPDDNAANLYEYDVETGILTDLTVDTKPGDGDGAAVLGMVTASEDGSYVYFVAEGRLTTQANVQSEEPVSGKPNLYLYHGGKVTFVAMLAPATVNEGEGKERGGDAEDWQGEQLESPSLGDWGPGQHTVRITPDGTRLAFESQRSLKGYDNEPVKPGVCIDSGSFVPAPCREVYLFDAEADGGAGALICASCDPSGARPAGPAQFGGHELGETGEGGVTASPLYLSQNLSEGGGRLFFQSPDALAPQDSNGLLDVYEWEQPGTSTCTLQSAAYSALSEGCVYPISDVAGGYDSNFMDATPTGEDVFIATKDQLVPEADGDSRVNVYDVRVGGGFPVSLSPPACANADSCKQPASPQPAIFGAPASATFSGPGNPSPPPAAVVKPRPLTGPQKLARALKACNKDRSKKRRARCEKQARARYGARKASKASDKRRAKR